MSVIATAATTSDIIMGMLVATAMTDKRLSLAVEPSTGVLAVIALKEVLDEVTDACFKFATKEVQAFGEKARN